jgi:hypothetical protein
LPQTEWQRKLAVKDDVNGHVIAEALRAPFLPFRRHKQKPPLHKFTGKLPDSMDKMIIGKNRGPSKLWREKQIYRYCHQVKKMHIADLHRLVHERERERERDEEYVCII